MHLTELAITNFRCLDQVLLSPSPTINLILGSNGAGKTSVLEAIFCLSRGRSFRANSLNKLIKDSQSSFLIRASLESDITHRLAIQANRDGSGSNYVAKIDGEAIKSLAELSYILPTIILDPTIHKLIEEGPKLRRQYLDWGVFHVEQTFMHEWRRYQRALKQRNAALKKGVPHSQISAWTEVLIESGTFIDAARQSYINSLSPNLVRIASGLLDADIKLTYRSGWPKDLSFTDALNKNREREKRLGLTVVGPHRADLIIHVGGLRVSSTEKEEDESVSTANDQFHQVQQRVSRGQQKLIASSLMLAQALLFKQQHDISPILLIDDPFAELDKHHSSLLLQEIEKLKAQTFVTALNPLEHPIFDSAKKFHVEHGEIRQI